VGIESVVVEGEMEPLPPPNDPGVLFIPCPDEASARKEAVRQQGLEPNGPGWTWDRIDGQWVAYPQREKRPDKKSWKRRVGEIAEVVFDPFNWS
jgi:hypothetical protein